MQVSNVEEPAPPYIPSGFEFLCHVPCVDLISLFLFYHYYLILNVSKDGIVP
jgi:hypothetical protein